MLTKLRSALSTGLTAIAIAGLVLIALSYAPPFLPLLVILGSLKLHLGLGVLAAALVLLVIGLWRRAVLAGALALASLVQIVLALLPALAPPAAAGATPLSVMSFNVLGYNWWGGGRATDYILKTLPDIVFLQEAGPFYTRLEALAAEYPYHIGCTGADAACDSLLLSRHPLGPADYFLPDARAPLRFFSTTVDLGGTRLTLVALHLTKVEFGAYQSSEYGRAANEIAAISGPVIVAGDFNTAPWAPRFVDFLAASGLQRAAIEPATWPAGFGLLDDIGVPIDHILVRGGSITEVNTLPDTYRSNHRGLIARVSFAPGN